MAKKGQASQLQTEINTEEDWVKLLQRDGLIVADVYSEWCGPCTGMAANLKKIKLEIGGDNLHLAIAKSDNITALERFRDKSEPTWMFISNGKMVNLMFGSNAPKLQKLIIEELKHLQAIREGAPPRIELDITELSEEERERQEKVDRVQKEAERVEAEAREKAMHDRIVANCDNILSQFAREGMFLALPICRDIIEKALNNQWEPNQLILAKAEKIIVTPDMLEELIYFTSDKLSEDLIKDLTSAPCLALLVEISNEYEGDPNDKILNFLFGDMMAHPGSKECILHKIVKAIENERKELESRARALAKPKIVEEVEAENDENKMATAVSQSTDEKSNSKTDSIILEREYLWAPADQYTKALALKLFFPKTVEHHIIPEPEPTPPHIAVAYDAFKRKDVMDAIQQWSEDVMRYGFFTSNVPGEAKLIAKTLPKFEARAAETTYDEQMVIQLAKKRGDALLAFAQLGPTYMSPNAVIGKDECKLFFPDKYDELEEEVVEVKKKVPKKKLKKGAATNAHPTETSTISTPIQEAVPVSADTLEVSSEQKPEESVEVPSETIEDTLPTQEEEQVAPIEADKATSPIVEGESEVDNEGEPASEPVSEQISKSPVEIETSTVEEIIENESA